MSLLYFDYVEVREYSGQEHIMAIAIAENKEYFLKREPTLIVISDSTGTRYNIDNYLAPRKSFTSDKECNDEVKSLERLIFKVASRNAFRNLNIG